jgi:predicted ATPase/signal transduction histidine kinase
MRANHSLEQLVGAPMPVGEFLPLALQLADRVAELHARGVIHKDLKPAAIRFDPATGQITIVSSGVAAPENPTLIAGSLPYMSPEQTGRTNRRIDSRSDLYSLGVTFYQLLAGRLPFEADDAVGWVHAHMARKPRPLDEVRRSVPHVLVELVDKLLAKAPDDRYQSALGLRLDLARCLRDWREHGRLASFPLGEHDVSDQFRIPQQLYGRDGECAALRNAFERVAETGAPELVLVSGYAGVGKSSVVRELLRFGARRGRFLTGKFEQYKRDIPYLTIGQAFRELALDILTESNSEIAAWRQRLAQALGASGKLIVDLVPELELIVGPQPPVPELPLTEAEARLRLVFHKLFAACAAVEHPLVMFIDDLQWVDTASLQLIANLMTDAETRHLLIIGAYRNNEVNASHPLMRALDPVRRSGAQIRDIVLQPLSDEDVGRLVADTVHASLAESAALARLVRDKTGGNPFFAIQFLTTLHHKGSIWFDRQAMRWRWNVEQIRAEGYTDNIAELMRGRLDTLPSATRSALQVAACLGGTIDAATLAIALGHDPAPVLQPAIDQDLLLESIHADRHTYRFPHDRVQEAAYALRPAPERARVHLELGRRLLASTPPEELVEKVFEIVSQLDHGIALASPQERERLAELHLIAGTRAQRSTAYASALHYLETGAALVENGKRAELVFALDLRRAECELLTGAREAAEQRLAALADRAMRVVDLAAVTTARIELYTTLGRSDRAVDAALAYLRRVGIAWPAHPTDDDVEREYERVWAQLGSRAIEELVDLPPMTDPDLRATMDVLSRGQSCALYTDEKLHSLVICRLVSTSLEHGNSDGSCYGYGWFGAILPTRFHNYAAGFRFGKLGFDLVETRGFRRWRASVYLDFAVLITPWTRHVRAAVELAARAFDVAQETGDLIFASYACACRPTLLIAAGEPLASVQRVAEAGLAFARKAGFTLVIDVLIAQLQLIRTLRGMTSKLGSFDDDQFAEGRFEQHLESEPSVALAMCWYWIRMLQARWFAGDYAGALAAAAKARPLLWIGSVFFDTAEYHFYAALACAAHHDAAPAGERQRLRDALTAHHAQLVVWAEHCPENFADRAALAGAELARLRGDVDEAGLLYEQAIHAAREHGFVHNEAIAYETAARFYRGRGLAAAADAHVREAHARYVRWGADAKARQLQRNHPELELQPSSASTTLAIHPEQLDHISVIKASQTISSVMDKERLSRTLLRFVLEEGGARRVVLLILHGGELEIAAEATVDDPAVEGGRVPASLLAYVERTQEPVLLDAAVDAGRFASDPYFADHHPRSVLCLPLRRRAESVALLYVENDLIPGTFTPERLLALELLAAQAAISLENARLLEREQLLGEATAVMAQTFDYRGVFGTLARLCARSFADWTVIDLEDKGEVVRVAGAHRDPDKEPMLRELMARYPASSGSTAPARQVLQTGEVFEIPAIADDQIRPLCVDDHHAELIRRLGTRSAIVVPLLVRETLIGALTLVSATVNRFGRGDVELALELGRRVAMVIDNVRLLEETRRALRLRDEFLRVASHELRTPIASLLLSAEALLRASELGRSVPPEVLDRSLRRVRGNTVRLEQLASELLDVTRIEQGRLELTPVELELGALVRDAVEHLALDLAAAHCPVTLASAAPVVGYWDRSRLEQVVTNLLTNAAKFGAGEPIEIQIERVGDCARLAVTDHGIGIDPARRPYVFDRFERAVPSSSYGGLGLGLYIAKSIVVAHGGTITVDSEPGIRSTFTVTLPALAAHASASCSSS